MCTYVHLPVPLTLRGSLPLYRQPSTYLPVVPVLPPCLHKASRDSEVTMPEPCNEDAEAALATGSRRSSTSNMGGHVFPRTSLPGPPRLSIDSSPSALSLRS